MQRCAACGELAIDDHARFCIGCGAPIRRFAVSDALPLGARPATAPSTAAPAAAAPSALPPPLASAAPPDLPPLVPMWLVVAGTVGLVALLVILFLAE